MKKKLRKILPLFILLIISLLALSACQSKITSPTQTTSDFNNVNTASFKSIHGLSLTLSLDSQTYQHYQDVSIIIDEKNTLSKTNNIAASDKLLSEEFTLGPCNEASPFGIAVFHGLYTTSNFSSATPLTIFDPNAAYACPSSSWGEGIAYDFKALSDIATISHSTVPPSSYDLKLNKELQLNGYWSGNSPGAVLNSFNPGVYTVVAGDEWGDLVVVHFTVSQ